MKKTTLKILIGTLICQNWIACTAGEGEINPIQRNFIERTVQFKLDSIRKVEQERCYRAVLVVARPKVDSVLALFDAQLATDTANQPIRPLKPPKPSVEIPDFTEEIKPKN